MDWLFIASVSELDSLHSSSDPLVSLPQSQPIRQTSTARAFLLIDVVVTILLLQKDVSLLSVLSRKIQHCVEALQCRVNILSGDTRSHGSW